MKRKTKKRFPESLKPEFFERLLGDPLQNFKNRMRNAMAYESFYNDFAKAMKRRTALNVRRLRMIERKNYTTRMLEDNSFMLFSNQNDLDEILARIGNFYLINIL